MEIFLQLILNGIIAGFLYGVVAVGYSMVYSILRFINFAHGYLAMLGMYIAYTLAVQLKAGFGVGVVVAIIVTCLVGWGVERAAYRPLRRSFYLAPLITSIGVSFALEAFALLVWGADILSYGVETTSLNFFGARITNIQVWILISVVASVILLFTILHKTSIGQAIRATADDLDMAALLGIDTDRVIVIVFIMGSAMAAMAGIFLGLETNLQPTIGLIVTIKAFAAVILGGLGNITGALIGGLVIGLVENIGIWFIPSVWKDFIAYAILLVILLFKPSGLLGVKQESDVKL